MNTEPGFPERDVAAPSEVIAERDEMFAGSRSHYFDVGRSAMASVRGALHLAGRTACETILDLPCGHGRVMRHLTAAYPNARITACDLNRDGVDFCAKTFGATPVYSQENLEELVLAGNFDLIWCGSLLTHLEKPRWRQFLSFFAKRLTENGVLLFTTHGRLSARWIGEGTYTYGLDPAALPELLADYERTGFAYAPYPGSPNYGITLTKPSWVLEQLQEYPHLRVILLNETAWDAHQDVYACVLAP
jgi:SAM-dependent methyltransferase